MGAIDIATDLGLILLPGWVVWDLRMHWGRKVVVVSAFLFRAVYDSAQAPLQEG